MICSTLSCDHVTPIPIAKTDFDSGIGSPLSGDDLGLLDVCGSLPCKARVWMLARSVLNPFHLQSTKSSGWNIRDDDDSWMCPRSMDEMLVQINFIRNILPIANIRLMYETFAYLILGRSEEPLEHAQPEEQHGFRT